MKKYRSDALAAIHETMEDLHEIGAVDERTMREFDYACLTPTDKMHDLDDARRIIESKKSPQRGR